MPRRKVFDKKTATTFSLVHRAQHDPLIHDEDAPSMVFTEKAQPTKVDFDDAGSTLSGTSYRSKKTNQREDMEDEFGIAVRANEGEAAQHGVFFDDTQYDYMQHMRDLGSGEGSSTWVEASNPADKQGKKQRLEDALRSMDLEDTQSVGASSITGSVARSLLPEDILPSEYERRRTYQDQQDVPDDIAGFQPDMDPRLREVLEALDDEEFVDDDEDIFAELTQDKYEVEKDEWDRLGEQQLFEDDEGWESDDTIKASSPPPPPPRSISEGEQLVEPPEDAHAQPPADPTDSAWMDEFKKFKSSDRATKEGKDDRPTPSALDASTMQSLTSGRRKKRKGAKTSTTNYSMTSSSLARTEPLRLLDARFEKTLESYRLAELPEDEDEDGGFDEGASATSGMTGLSKASKGSRYSQASGRSGFSRASSALDPEAPKLIRSDFDSIMDEFLATHSTTGKHGRRVKRVGPQTGMQQLDEIRSQLGPARIKSMSKPS